MKNYDIIIIGSGMVGAALALTLRQTALNIAIIDAAPSIITAPNNDGRKLVLSFGSTQILSHYDLWQYLEPDATPIEKLHISQQGHFAAVRIAAQQYDAPALGYVISAENLLNHLQTQLADCKNMTFYQPGNVIALTLGEQPTVTVEQEGKPTQLTSKLIIACDGAHSATRSLAGIDVDETAYQKSALITKVKLARSHDNTAYQRFTQHGIMGMLPMANNMCGFVWTAPTELMTTLVEKSNADLLREIQTDFGYRVGRMLAIEDRSIFPIKEIIAKEQSKPGLVLLGNAAHNLSPVAAQGFNLALQDILVLANLLSTENLNAETIITEYLAARVSAQKNVIKFTHSLMTWFNPQNSLYSLANLGLAACDLIAPAKNYVAELGAGLTPAVKKLMGI